jgi:ABC-type nitrate/sulfonate/bicarbonate transport system substrate-binding protein
MGGISLSQANKEAPQTMRTRQGWRVAAVAIAAVAVLSCAGITATLASASSRTTSSAQSGRTLSVGVQESFNMLPIFVALRNNYFKGTDITGVKFIIFTSLPSMFAAISQGQLDVGLQTISGINAFNNATSASKLSVVAPVALGGLNWAVLNGSPIPTATTKDWKTTVMAFKGMKIGVPAAGGILDLYTRYLASQVGLNYGSDYTTVPVGVGPPAVAALQNHLVDVITGDSLNAAQLIDQKLGHTVLDLGQNQGPSSLSQSLSGVYFTSQSAIQNDPALFKSFSDGLAKARAFMAKPTNKKSILDLLTRKVGLTSGEANYLYDTQVSKSYATVTLNQNVFNQTVAAYVAAGALPAPGPAYSDIVASFAH